ncbi:hypothetical protein LCGC14_0423580 [marine sediment metagenome]|uniref:PD-(D/E)XK endonuclease-like domain-containing protein n=1 Tax=marine sediment metagenome TaxID=412755 RepID=A0A0F9SQ91_9ZZZZ
MRIYEEPTHAERVIQELRTNKLSDRDWDEVHASDFFGCLRRTYLDRDEATKKPLTRGEVVKFSAGFAIQEWFLGEEPPGITIEDDKGRPLIFSRDGFDEERGLVLEFKTTGRSMKDFDVKALQEQEEWLVRTRAYCAVFGVRTAVFLVYFLFQRDFRSFTVVYSDREVKEGLALAKRRGAQLWNAFEKRQLPGIDTRMSDLNCYWCPHISEQCPGQLPAVQRLKQEWASKRKPRKKKT